MARIPSSRETVQDPGLGVVGPSTSTPVFVGVTESGTANEVSFYTDPNQLLSEQGFGPATLAAALTLVIAGGPVGIIPTAASVPASNGTVSSPGGPAVTVGGDATDDYSCQVLITSGGALGVAKFQYSLDGGKTFSSTLAVPAGGAYTMGGTGVTLTFSAGTYVSDDLYEVSLNCAASNSSDLVAAMQALDADPRNWDFAVHITSANAGDASAHRGLAVALQGELLSMATRSKFKAGMQNATADDSSPLADYTGAEGDRVDIQQGLAVVTNPLGQVGNGNPSVQGIVLHAARAAGSLISTDLKRVPGNGINDGGPLPRVISITVDGRTDGGEGLDDLNIGTLRTYEGKGGFYITQSRLSSPTGSDFTVWPRRRVMDRACTVVHEAQTDFVGRGLRTNDDGTILEADALRLEEEVQVKLDAVLTSPRNAEGTGGHVSAVRYRIDRTQNILATSIVVSTVGIRPLAHVDYVETTIGFTVDLSGDN